MAGSPRGALLEGSTAASLRTMAVPMALGMIFMVAVNIIDTFWVARLGTDALAAMTFTFPVVGLVINLALGLMIGTSTAVARAIGSGAERDAARLTTHALYLSLALVIGISAIGLLSQDVAFRALGAEPHLIEMIKDYMTVWYAGVVLLVIPLIVNGALRAAGDARSTATVMMLIALVNAVLDPLFIFGAGPIPALGLQGAAIATLIARFAGMVFAFYVLLRRTQLLDLHVPTGAEFADSTRRLLSVGGPAAVTNAIGPLAVGLVTAIVAGYGPSALAAYGIGARVDALVLMPIGALAASLSAFIGQNWGAHLRVRVAEGIRVSLTFVLSWGVVGAILLFALAGPLADLFTDDPAVRGSMVTYLRTIPVGYAFLAAVSIASASFNAVDRAVRSTWLSLLRSLILAVPAAYVGGLVGGLSGVYLGLVIASVVASLFGVRWLRTLLAPDGEATPELGEVLTPDASTELLDSPELSKTLAELLPPVLALEGMTLRRNRRNLVGLYVGRRELAHLHGEGRLDLPLPVEIGDNLTARGIVSPHPLHDDNGWYVHDLRDRASAEETIWLLRLAHLLYELSQRGGGDPVTRAEMDAFTISERCVSAMTAAAERWELQIEAA